MTTGKTCEALWVETRLHPVALHSLPVLLSCDTTNIIHGVHYARAWVFHRLWHAPTKTQGNAADFQMLLSLVSPQEVHASQVYTA